VKKKVVIASVLKAVDDVRMYEKFANSIIKHFPSEVEVHILGANSNKSQTPNPQTSNPKPQAIFFHPISNFDRLSKKRWTYSKIFLNKVLQLKPSLLIINSPELLLPALLIKIKLKISIFYDVRENYWRNILYQPTYKSYLRPILAAAVRSLEYVSRFWIDHYLLAEKCYAEEFSFGKGKSEIIENKYVSEGLGVRSKDFEISTLNPKQPLKSKPSPLCFLYTGTISPTYGTVNTIRFIKKIRKYLPDSQLLIKGFCSDKKYFQRLENEAKNHDFITLEISEQPINHQEIIAAFRNHLYLQKGKHSSPTLPAQ
jgi:glycosyltransferase involved in cell wall biosynthesis